MLSESKRELTEDLANDLVRYSQLELAADASKLTSLGFIDKGTPVLTNEHWQRFESHIANMAKKYGDGNLNTLLEVLVYHKSTLNQKRAELRTSTSL